MRVVEAFPGVDAGVVAVTPVDLDGVAAHWVDAGRMHIRRDHGFLEALNAGQFVDTDGAGAFHT